MSILVDDKYLGHATAYAYAKSKGYTGTEEEFAELMASYATVAEAAEASAQAAAQSATAASGSASAASTSARTATTKAEEASQSATNAQQYATNANQSATQASGSATTAQGAAQTATAKANEASASAAAALQQAQNAMTHASNAQTFANNAQTSATQAAASANTANDSANLAVEVAESIPSDYTALSNDVDDLKNALTTIPSAIHPTMTSGRWLNNGIETANGNQQLAVSDYIEIPPFTYEIVCYIGWFIAQCTTIAFYTENKTFISGVSQQTTKNIQTADTIPSNAKYFRLSNYDASIRPEHDEVTYYCKTLERIGNIEDEITDLFDLTDKNAPNWEGKKWCVIGDSITEENFRATEHYWSFINDLTNITIDNKGIGGTGYKQTNPFYNRINADTFPTDCNLITMFGGINDILGWSTTLTIGTYTDTTDATICGCVNLAIDALEAKYPVYVPLGIISPIPCKLDTSYEVYAGALYPNQYPLIEDCRMETFVTELKKICALRGYPFLDLYHDSGLRPWDATVKQALFAPPAGYGYVTGDGLHPNADGHEKIYRKILEFVKGVIV